MCVIFWSIDQPGYDLIIASNRDEYLARETLPAAWHCFEDLDEPRLTLTAQPTDEHPIVSARDGQSGGTWLGMTRNGFFAMLTNYTELPPTPPENGFHSRGKLVRDWLVRAAELKNSAFPDESTDPQQRDENFILDFLKEISSTLGQFPGFSLLVGSSRPHSTNIGHTTNRTPKGEIITREPDIFTQGRTREQALDPLMVRGLSNSVLRHPFTKVHQGVKLFNQAVNRNMETNKTEGPSARQPAEETLIEDLCDLLWTSSDPPPTRKAELGNSLLISPVKDGERGYYATRTSTVILIRKANHLEGEEHRTATFVERDVFRLPEDGEEPVRVCGGSLGRNCEERRYSWVLD